MFCFCMAGNVQYIISLSLTCSLFYLVVGANCWAKIFAVGSFLIDFPSHSNTRTWRFFFYLKEDHKDL